MNEELFITGAGVSASSGIPTFRGNDGFWTVGSVNYTPQEMATRTMYLNQPDEFLIWYFKRFAKYRHIKPNSVHEWLSTKKLITQNIDGLDGKAGNENYIPIHGRLDKVSVLEREGVEVELLEAPWDAIANTSGEDTRDKALKTTLLDAFRIPRSMKPEPGVSLKPFVLLFDEYYTDLYRMGTAEAWMAESSRMVFIGTSFSVNITAIALRSAISRGIPVEIVDPAPVDLGIPDGMADITWHRMTAKEWVG